MNRLRVGQIKSSKYGNTKVTIDGHKFDSKAEAKHYSTLKLLQRGGKIHSLELQPKYLLQDGFIIDGKKYQPIHYISDFRYIQDDEVVVVDVKGALTAEYKLKKKMFLKKYGDEVSFIELMIKDV